MIIGDPHASPNYSNERFQALGNLILAERPTNIICIGDWADMPSLSSYDKGRSSFEGRRYKKDIDAAIEAQHLALDPIKEYNKKNHKAYHPKMDMFLGNHDNRIDRAADQDSWLQGTITIDNLQYKEFGWTVYPFLKIIVLDGIAFSHYFASGVLGRPLGGETIGKTLINKMHMSAVQGHTHILDFAERTTAAGNKIFGLSCGCFVHPGLIEAWNQATYHMWYRGIIILDNVQNGYFDEMRTISQEKILRDYL